MTSELRRAAEAVFKKLTSCPYTHYWHVPNEQLNALKSALSAPDELATAMEHISTLVGMADPYGVCTATKHPVQRARDFLSEN